MKALAVIPARGGSKRIPGKNIRPFAGQPIIHWPIRAAIDSGLFDTVMVSTDSEEIAAISRDCGAEVPFLRSAETSGDHAILLDVMGEVLGAYHARGQRFDRLCCILATAALLRPETLKAGADLMNTQGFDTVFPVTPHAAPIQRALRQGADGATGMLHPENYAVRSQDLEPTYYDPGQFYWMTAEACASRQPMFAGAAGSLILSPLEVQDIDTPDDWRLAELKFALRQQEKPHD